MQFNKATRMFKSFIQTNVPNSIVEHQDECNIEVDEQTFKSLYENKYNQLILKDDESIDILTEKPSQFHKWSIEQNQWIEDTNEKFEVSGLYVRDFRLGLLKELDLLVMNPLRFATFTDEQKAELEQYRQDLLDVPQQTGFPLDVVFPDKPLFL